MRHPSVSYVSSWKEGSEDTVEGAGRSAVDDSVEGHGTGAGICEGACESAASHVRARVFLRALLADYDDLVDGTSHAVAATAGNPRRRAGACRPNAALVEAEREIGESKLA
jgi:hypothetical protein